MLDLIAYSEGTFQSTRPRGARRSRSGTTTLATAFQSTRPRGARPLSEWARGSLAAFQSTRPRGARRPSLFPLGHWDKVSIHAPARGATGHGHSPADLVRTFQSTRPRGARPGFNDSQSTTAVFQSTRPRGARLPSRPPLRSVGLVSIHAPARGATWSRRPGCRHPPRFNPRARAGRDGRRRRGGGRHARRCFNPRARAGRDVLAVCAMTTPCEFQSTRPRGARPCERHEASLFLPVSIHAPARGATSAISWLLNSGRLFQSTRPRGARLAAQAKSAAEAKFQSTRPRGARRAWSDMTTGGRHVSIHAPARGATRATARPTRRTGLFQSTRPRGARLDPVAVIQHLGLVSIHAPARGATWSASKARARSCVSIHAPARGATMEIRHEFAAARSFNPRARAGRDTWATS